VPIARFSVRVGSGVLAASIIPFAVLLAVWAFVLGLTVSVTPFCLQYLAGTESVQAMVTQVVGKKAVKAMLKAAGVNQQPATSSKATSPTIKAPAIKANQAPQGSAQPKAKGSSPSDAPGGKRGAEATSGDQFRPWESVIEGATKIDGLFTLYRNEKTGKVFAEIKPEQLEQNHLMVMTLESAIGEQGLYSGLPLGDFLFRLRRVNNNLQFVVRCCKPCRFAVFTSSVSHF
jgi:hypothetical protein